MCRKCSSRRILKLRVSAHLPKTLLAAPIRRNILICATLKKASGKKNSRHRVEKKVVEKNWWFTRKFFLLLSVSTKWFYSSNVKFPLQQFFHVVSPFSRFSSSFDFPAFQKIHLDAKYNNILQPNNYDVPVGTYIF